MKVILARDYRSHYTLDDLDRAKMVIQAEKEDEASVKEYAEMAIREALGNEDCILELLCAKAETAKNSRVYDLYGENTGNLDVWITGCAETCNGFIRIGAYLSDIWQTGAIKYRQHMFIKYGRVNRDSSPLALHT